MNDRTLLFYINSIHDGGAERAIIQIAYQFAKAGYRSILVTSFVDEFEYPVPDIVERISIEQEQLKQSRLKRNISRIKALRALCKEYKPAVLVSFMGEPNFRALIATIGLKTKNIVSVRADPKNEYSGTFRKLVGKCLLPHAEGCVFQTEEAKAWFPKKLQKKSAVILNQVGEQFFDTQYIGGHNIVTLGRLNWAKNHRMLIEAFAKIADEYTDTDLEIYGMGELEDELKSQIANLGLTGRVHLKGQTNNSETVLANARMFVLSSDTEGMPNALMEALSVGVPCISTDCPCGGPKTLIKDGENGLLVPVGDADATADAMRRLLSDDGLAKTLSINAKRESANYKPEFVFAKWQEHVEGIIKRGGKKH